MKIFRAQKRFMTLIEMMIVMFLIAMITGVLAYNYTGSLDEGKAFKTKEGISKIQRTLELYAADNDIDDIKDDWEQVIRKSPMIKNADELLKDGWGGKYTVQVTDGEIQVSSPKYDSYSSKTDKNSLFKKK